MWSWGNNTSGQLGNNSTTKGTNPQKIQIENNTKFKAIAAGEKFSLALDTDGNVWTWGENTSGQLGNNSTTNSRIPQKIQIENNVKIKAISAGREHVLALDTNGNMWSWGKNNNGQLGNNSTTNSLVPQKIQSEVKFKDISTGSYHNMALDEKNNIWTWGNNYSYQLGNGTRYNENVPMKMEF